MPANQLRLYWSSFAYVLLRRAGDNETADYFSRELGDQDIARRTFSQSTSNHPGSHGSSSSTSTSIERRRQAAVLPSELLALPTCTAT